MGFIMFYPSSDSVDKKNLHQLLAIDQLDPVVILQL
jgi:hypothetical protein